MKIPPDAFVRTRFQHARLVAFRTLGRFTATAFSDARDGFGESNQVDFERWLALPTLLRWSNSFNISEVTNGWTWGTDCWENYMPLARFSLYESGVEIYIASTADDGDSWQSTLVHIALESRSFVIAPCHFQRAGSYPDDFPLRHLIAERDVLGRGGSAILAPDGTYLAGPLYDEEGVLYAELDPDLLPGAPALRRGRPLPRPDVLKLSRVT